jgi:hypothetical protein
MRAFRMTIRSGPTGALLTLLLCSSMGRAQAADRFVATTGNDTANDCLSSVSPCRTVGYGLTQAASGDVLKIAVGVYVENVIVNTPITVTLSGGWAHDFSAQDPDLMPTVLRAALELPVVTVLANGITIAFTADGLTVQGGRNLPEVLGTPCQEGLGGGICAQVSAGGTLSVALSRVVLKRNLASGSGGGLAAVAYPNEVGSSLTVTVTDSTVTQNAAGFGGGIAIVADEDPTVNVTIDRVLFQRNRAAGVHGASILSPLGGGLSVSHGTGAVGQNAQVLVQNSIFEGNRATRGLFLGGAGGLFARNTGCAMGSCPLKVVNNVFIKNRGTAGAGGIAVTGGAELVNVTATRNTATLPISRGGEGGGGVAIGSGTILNSILWGNRGVHPRDLDVGVNLGLDHSDVNDQGGPGSVTDLGGNISADPLFVGPDHIHLSPGSPCIDTGTCTGAPTTDFEGDPRPTGAGCDMGADEFVP